MGSSCRQSGRRYVRARRDVKRIGLGQNDDYLGGGEVAGEAVRPHVARALAAGASMIVTVPMAGYVSADKAPGGDVNQTPDFLNARFFESRPTRGRGFSYPPDTGDRVVYQDELVAWLESTFDTGSDPARTIFYSPCNYDGAGGRFGDTSIGASTSNHETTSVYASVDEGRDDRMVLVAINKSTGPTSAEILVAHPDDFARARTWQIGATASSPARGPDLAPTARNAFRLEMPASSVTTIVLSR